MYKIELIYFVFPLACLLFNKFRNGVKINAIGFWILFVGIYCCSLNGSDILGYEELYNSVGSEVPLSQIHGEIGFKLLMLISNKYSFSYETFRILFLIINTTILFYSIYKISPNYFLSLYFLSTLFVVYIISSYRQYMVMSLTFFFYYIYTKKYIKIAILGIILLLSIHMSASIAVLFLLFYHQMQKKVGRINNNIAKIVPLLIVMTLIFRFIMLFFLESGPIHNIVYTILGEHSNEEACYLSLGLLSRVVCLLGISYMYRNVKPKKQIVQMLFWLYVMGMFCYISIPLEFTMGRLINNVNIINILLVPLLFYSKKNESIKKYKQRPATINIRGLITIGLISISFVILTNQLKKQDGYTPYMNVLLGDQLSTIKELNK